MKNNKMLLIGGIAVVLIACAVFMFGGGSDSQGGKTPVFGNDYEKAQAAMEAGEPEQAIELLKKFTAENPKDAKAWLLLGDAYKSIETYEMPLGDKKNAVEAFVYARQYGSTDAALRIAWEKSPICVATEFWGSDDGITPEEIQERIKITESLPDLEERILYDTVTAELVGLTERGYDPDAWWFQNISTLQDEGNLDAQFMSMQQVLWANINPKRLLNKNAIRNCDKWWNINFSTPEKLIKEVKDNASKSVWAAGCLTAINGENTPENYDKAIKAGSKFAAYMKLRDLQTKVKMGTALTEKEMEEAFELVKMCVTGPYAITYEPIQIFEDLPMAQKELDNITKTIESTSYSENGGTWGDVKKKITDAEWLYGYGADAGRNWITRRIVLTGTYDGKPIYVAFSVKYNSLKKQWEVVQDRGLTFVGVDPNERKARSMTYHFTGKKENEDQIYAKDDIFDWMAPVLGVDANRVDILKF